jgi:hypothetical protein
MNVQPNTVLKNVLAAANVSCRQFDLTDGLVFIHGAIMQWKYQLSS